jgi:hypothetical protein
MWFVREGCSAELPTEEEIISTPVPFNPLVVPDEIKEYLAPCFCLCMVCMRYLADVKCIHSIYGSSG